MTKKSILFKPHPSGRGFGLKIKIQYFMITNGFAEKEKKPGPPSFA
jgi:hypothetical protein